MWDNSNSGVKTTTVIQLGRKAASEKALNNILINHYQQNFNATDVEVLLTLTWKYFLRWSPVDLNSGRHWDVFSMQGKRRTWFAGIGYGIWGPNETFWFNSSFSKLSSASAKGLMMLDVVTRMRRM